MSRIVADGIELAIVKKRLAAVERALGIPYEPPVITIKMIQYVHEKTGYSMEHCKKALELYDGDVQMACYRLLHPVV